MKLLTQKTASGCRAGAWINGEVLDLAAAFRALSMVPWAPGDIGEVLRVGDEGLNHCQRAVDRIESASTSLLDGLREREILRSSSVVRLASPVLRPGLIMLAGRSYHSHLEEMTRKLKLSKSLVPPEPNAFNQSPNSVIGSGDAILLPHDYPNMVDYEAELAVVFGRRCHNVAESEVMQCLAGFTLMNDISARDWNEGAMGSSGAVDFTKIRLGKQFPTFCPIGPWITPVRDAGYPDEIEFRCTLNGVEVQHGNTRDLVFSIAETIAYYARWHVFEAGDIFSMGTPAGVGFAREPSVFLKAGDVISVSGERLGTLTNRIAAA